jgi:Rha family phage regulatory protein
MNNSVACNSRDVADYFKKRHDHIFRDIVTVLPKIGDQAMFTEVSIPGRTGFGIRHYRAFDMTKDGFALLAMGFTEDKALDFKLRYIEELGAMEESLKAVQLPPISRTFAEALRLAADQAEKIEQLEASCPTSPCPAARSQS